jgi:hypothetical protein
MPNPRTCDATPRCPICNLPTHNRLESIVTHFLEATKDFEDDETPINGGDMVDLIATYRPFFKEALK